MKSRSLLVLFSFTAYAVICLSGCKKNSQEDLSPGIHQSMFSIADAKQWYSASGNLKASFSNARTDTFKNKFGKFTPVWDKALNTEDSKYYIVESPLQFDNAPGYSVKGADKSIPVINGSTRLLVLKHKETGVITSALMHIYSSTGSGTEKITYGKRDDGFSGRIFFTDIDGNFFNGWKYENGKVTGKSKIALNKRNNYKLAPTDLGGDACTTYTVYILMRTCYYDMSGHLLECTPWEVLFSYPEDTCPGAGDGAINEPTCDQSEVDKAIEEFNNYILFTDASSYNEAAASIPGGDPITGVLTVDVVSATMGGWKIKADIRYGYYHDRAFDGTRYNDYYNLFDYQCGNGYFTGSNMAIKTTYTTTTPTTNIVMNNNTPNCFGLSYVVGTIKHVLNTGIKFPYCDPLAYDKTVNINRPVYFRPK